MGELFTIYYRMPLVFRVFPHGQDGFFDQLIQSPAQTVGALLDHFPGATGGKLFVLELFLGRRQLQVGNAFGGAHQRYSAMTAQAPADSAIFACSGVVTSMITPPLSICASWRFSLTCSSGVFAFAMFVLLESFDADALC